MTRNSGLLTKLLVFINVVTIVLYLFPPIVRLNHNAPFVVIYLTLSVLLIHFGLKKGLTMGRRSLSRKNKVYTPSSKHLRFVFVFYALTFILKYAYLLGFSPFNISGMIQRLMIGIADPQLGYQLVQERSLSVIPWSVYFIISLIDQVFFIFILVVWKSLNRFQIVSSLFFMAIELFYWAGSGTGFGVVTLFTNIVFAQLLRPSENNRVKISKSTVFAIAFFLFLALVFFSYNINGRAGGDSEEALDSLMGRFTFREDSMILQLLPESLWSSYYYVYSYACQGYEALGCAFDIPVTWTGLCGNNPALMYLVKSLTGYNAMADSYMAHLETEFHIDSLSAWHSAYLWWANDFTIWGALVIVFFLSFFCGFAYVIGVEKGDALSRIVYIVLANMVLFLFANNSYLSNVFYSFMFIFPYWTFTRFLRIRIGS